MTKFDPSQFHRKYLEFRVPSKYQNFTDYIFLQRIPHYHPSLKSHLEYLIHLENFAPSNVHKEVMKKTQSNLDMNKHEDFQIF